MLSYSYRALIVKILEYTNKCTIQQHNVFTIKTLELRHVLTLFVGHSEGVLPATRVETSQSPSGLIVKTSYCNTVHVLVFS